MKTMLRWAGYALGVLLVLLLVAAAAVWLISSHRLTASVQAKPEHLAQPTQAQLADGERQARALGCFSCHGEGLRGNKMFDEPNVGTIWAPNLTQVAARATDEQLAAAVRQGVSVEGSRPLMIMPAEEFQHLDDQQVSALIAFIRRLPRRGNDVPANVYGPIGRIGLVIGKFKTAPQLVSEYSTSEPIRLGADVEPGRKLATLYCSACHGADLTGKEVQPGESSPDLTIAGAYDLDGFRKLLRTGVPAGGQKLRLMGTAARGELSHLTDAEVAEIHSYLVARAQKSTR
jgi:cytochrome c553